MKKYENWWDQRFWSKSKMQNYFFQSQWMRKKKKKVKKKKKKNTRATSSGHPWEYWKIKNKNVHGQKKKTITGATSSGQRWECWKWWRPRWSLKLKFLLRSLRVRVVRKYVFNFFFWDGNAENDGGQDDLWN